MNKKSKRRSALLVAGAAAVTAVSGCGKSEQKQWAASPGTRGYINMDAVREAFIKNPSYDSFEDRVNEIFEGDHLVIFKAEKVTDGFRYIAMEDLDNDKSLGFQDDELFKLTVAAGTAKLEGAGVNSYYSKSWPYDPAEHEKLAGKEEKSTGSVVHHHHHGRYFYDWYGYNRPWGGGYYTPNARYDEMSQNRDAYRSSSGFASQVKQNSYYETRASGEYGSGFTSSASNISSNRQSHINNTDVSSSEQAKNSGWSARQKAGIASAAVASAAVGKSRSSSRSSARSGFGSSRSGYGGFRSSSGFGI